MGKTGLVKGPITPPAWDQRCFSLPDGPSAEAVHIHINGEWLGSGGPHGSREELHFSSLKTRKEVTAHLSLMVYDCGGTLPAAESKTVGNSKQSTI